MIKEKVRGVICGLFSTENYRLDALRLAAHWVVPGVDDSTLVKDILIVYLIFFLFLLFIRECFIEHQKSEFMDNYLNMTTNRNQYLLFSLLLAICKLM